MYKVYPAYEVWNEDLIVTQVLFKYLCNYFTPICNEITRTISQTTYEFNDYYRSQVYFGHYPTGSSVKQFQHVY